MAFLLLVATAALLMAQTAAKFTSDGKLEFPADYREWVFLSSGKGMTYGPSANPNGPPMFDNVFVNPASYKKFQETGTWPDKTMLVLEVRGAESKGSINQRGNFQTGDVMGTEVHIKDEAKFPGKWAFFSFDNGKVGNLFPSGAACYTCHQAHGAVDTTFVQFYPTMLSVAKSKGTLSAAYLKDASTAK